MKYDPASMTFSVNAPAEVRVEKWRPNDSPADSSRAAFVDAEIDMLAEVLHAVVHAGAGVSFFTLFSIDDARAFWVDKVLPQVRGGTHRVLVARFDERSEWGELWRAQGSHSWHRATRSGDAAQYQQRMKRRKLN